MNELPEEIVNACEFAETDAVGPPRYAYANLARYILDECEKRYSKLMDDHIMIHHVGPTLPQPPAPEPLEPCPFCSQEPNFVMGGVHHVCPARPTIYEWNRIARAARMNEDRLTSAVNAECSCGGRGFEDPKACVACRVYGRVVAARAARGARP